MSYANLQNDTSVIEQCFVVAINLSLMLCSMLKNEPQELCNITLDQNAAAFGRKFVITKDVYLCTVIYLTDTEQLTGL